jgi:predicted lipid-binding transport protein (Tim44 family)
MNVIAMYLAQTIIYWTLLVLLISWIIVFTALALRPTAPRPARSGSYSSHPGGHVSHMQSVSSPGMPAPEPQSQHAAPMPAQAFLPPQPLPATSTVTLTTIVDQEA